MLIVRRRAGQAIQLGEGVEIRVLECGPQRVTLGIVAPDEVRVLRTEWDKVGEENQAAAAPESVNQLLARLR